MRRAIRTYALDFGALVALMIVASGIAVYILHEQRLRFPLVDEKPFRVEAVLSDAQAVTPGQGQSVRVAGVKVGDISGVELENGRAVVKLDIEQRFRGLMRTDTTALLRAKTGLKDMFLEVDPGHGRPVPEGSRIELSNTLPDVDLDEVLAVLDSDTRDYLKLLISGAGKGTAGRAGDLRAALKRLGPLARDLRRLNGATARRRQNLRRLVTSYGLLVEELGRADGDVVRLVRSGDAVFRSLAAERDNLRSTVAQLPGTLRETERALGEVDRLGRRLPPTVAALRPAVRSLEPAMRAVLPLAREGTPILRDRLRPLTRVATPRLGDLGVAAGRLAKAGPDLTTSVGKVNRLANIIAFNPAGAEPLTGDFERDRARQEGYLFWFAWVAQTGTSLFSTADGQGVFRRFTFGGSSCTVFTSIGLPQPVVDALGTAGLCSGSPLP